MTLSPGGWFAAALAATLAFRFWLAGAAPVTADEAYFILWGRAPAFGYYDHPPMIGWWLAPLAALSEAPWLMRLPAVLAPALAALMVRAALLRGFGRDAGTANLAAAAVLLVPMNVWNVLITTDVPLMLFSVAAAIVFALAAERRSDAGFLAAGALLGLAFLSKYFAVLLGLAFLAWAIAARRPRAALLVVAGALPAGLANLWWNVESCWSNVMFNAINRHDEDGGWSLVTPLLYAASIAYLAAPLAWFAWRGRARLAAARARPAEGALLAAWLLPLAVFALLSPVKRIGLHWLLSFLPALVLTLALALERRALLLSVRWLAAFAAVHVAAAVTVAALPAETWAATRLHAHLVFPGRIDELLRALEPERRERVLAADSYSTAALLGYHTGGPVPMFGLGTSHARQSDIATDWRAHAGRDFVIVRRERPLEHDYAPYFRDIEIREIPLAGGRHRYHAVLGRGFDYPAYREGVLAEIERRWYRIPAWLPAGGCYFFERYGRR